jgi:hypothetical protein
MTFKIKQKSCGKNVILKTLIIVAEVSIFLQNASRNLIFATTGNGNDQFIVFLVPVDADDILWFDVEVDDAPGVQVGQPCQTFLTVTNTLSSFSTSEHS